MSKVKLTCPRCGAPMNHHADKLQSTELEAPSSTEELKNILQIHFCAGCGHTEVRQDS